MVAKNEADRYLADSVNLLVHQVDDLFVFDDRSEDDTAIIARMFTRNVRTRQQFDTSFAEHEGKFRALSWKNFEQALEPEAGDWVFTLDADEFAVGCTKESIHETAKTAAQQGCVAVMISIPEVFGWDQDDTPLVRTDGLWATIKSPRLFKYETDGVFSTKKMGCGSTPTYADHGPFYQSAYTNILHFGYAREADKQTKMLRYQNVEGHNENHVASIGLEPTLCRWTGPVPAVSKP